jgi:peptidyl-prolyl cis-trans isomerase C
MTISNRKLLILAITVGAAALLSACDKKETKKPAPVVPAVEEPAVKEEQPKDEGPLPANVLARVGDWSITIEEFNQRLKLLKQGIGDFNENDPQTRATVLNELIRQQLLVKDAENSQIANKKEVKEAIEDFRRTLLVQELATSITKNVTATEEEGRKYYEDNKAIFMKWKVRQIVVPDEATAKNILVQVLQGGDFAAIAQAQSKDKTAANGGLIDDVTKSPEEVQKAVLPLEAGGTSNVFKGPQGYYIVHVDEKKPEPFANVKKDLIYGLTLRKQQSAILEYIENLAQKNKVEVNNELLMGSSAPKK